MSVYIFSILNPQHGYLSLKSNRKSDGDRSALCVPCGKQPDPSTSLCLLEKAIFINRILRWRVARVTSILFEILRVTSCHRLDTAILKPIPVNYFYHIDFDIQSSTKSFSLYVIKNRVYKVES